MQSLAFFQSTRDGLQPARPELGPESAALVRIRASQELEVKSLLQSMQDNAVRHKEQGNRALELRQCRHAVKEFNQALEHAHAMMEYLEMDRPPPMNGYQLRALARGQPLPRRGPQALDPFRAVVHANRSLAFLWLDAYDRAVSDAEEACRLEPKYLKGWVRRATALAAGNRREEALAVLDEALSRACPSEAAKEQVCKLIVNLRALGPVHVKPPEEDLPVVYKDSGRPKRKKPPREIVKVPLGMMKTPEAAAEENNCCHEAAEEAHAEVDRRDLGVFLQEDWHATHLGGRWRQTCEEICIVLILPRRPKPSELLVQIRLQHVWVLIRKPGAAGDAGQEDYETVVDAALSKPVKPSESCWTLEAGASRELHLSLQKQTAGIKLEGSDGATPLLWDRAFEADAAVDLADVVAAKAAKAQQQRLHLQNMVRVLAEQARAHRKLGDKAEAKRIERYVAEICRQMEMQA